MNSPSADGNLSWNNVAPSFNTQLLVFFLELLNLDPDDGTGAQAGGVG